MKLRVRNRNRGFTIVELLMASFIFSFLMVGLMGFTRMFTQMRHGEQAKLDLTGQARITMDQMISGIRTTGNPQRFGLLEAQGYLITGAQNETIQLTGSDGNVRIIRRNGLNIDYLDNFANTTVLYDPNGAAANDAAKYQTTLNFTEIVPNVIRIRLMLAKLVLGRWHHASMETDVHIRNS